jgi:ferrous-iron efflux pump FieF
MRLEQKATLASMSVAAILVTMKLFVAVWSGSVAVLASAVDSLLDLCISAFNFFVLHNSRKAPDAKFNFGRSKLEPLAAAIEGIVIVVSALFILYQAALKIINGSHTQHVDISIAVMVASTIITAILVFFLVMIAKKTKNMVVKADALHYKTDLLSNTSVLAALILISFTKLEVIDPILGILIAFYMAFTAIPIISEGVHMLLDASLGEADIKKIKSLLNKNSEITAYHYLTTRRSGFEIFISVHLVFDIDTKLFVAHAISDKIEMQMKKLFPDYEVNTIIHLDPYDDSKEEELH